MANYLYNGIDLRSATVFDFTEDQDLLSGFLHPELGISNQEDYLRLAKGTSVRQTDLLEFAELTANAALQKKLAELFPELFSAFNE